MSRQPISQADIDKYWLIFSHHASGGQKLTGDQAFSILRSSGLSTDQLAKIWDLADIDQDGDLDFEEFCVAMRLIYDVMNGEFKSVPTKLPDWLVPESKAHLIQAGTALTSGGEEFERPAMDDDDTPGLKNGFEWYMSPENKRKYEGIYMANAGAHGQIGFAAMNDLYVEINVPDSEVTKAWNLVNPSRTPTIGKDQCIVFLHILNNRHEGYRIPTSVPPSLRSSFEQNQINYDIESVKPPQRAGGPDRNTISGKKAAFGESYISRLGIGGSTYKHSGTDFGATKDEDWEEVRLKRELADLEKKISDAESASEKRRNRDRHGASGSSKIALVRRELEQMLEYKRRQLRELDDAESGGSGNRTSEAVKSLKSARDDLEVMKEQVDALEQHLKRRQSALGDLLQEIEEEKANFRK